MLASDEEIESSLLFAAALLRENRFCVGFMFTNLCLRGWASSALFPAQQSSSERIKIVEAVKAKAKKLFGRCTRILTGFRPKAQGCEPRATLGHRPTNIPNRNAVAALPLPPARPKQPC